MESTLSLETSLAALRRKYASMLKPELAAVMEHHIDSLRANGFVQNARSAGQEGPSFSLPDGHGKIYSSKELLERGPLLVVFFRGTWCPYCAAELRALSAIAPEIEKAGGTIVAISPEAPERRDARVESAVQLRMLHDRDNLVGKAYGVVYEFPEDLRALYGGVFKNDIALRNGVTSWELPIPAHYVISPHGTIYYARVDPDYRYAPEPRDLLDIVRSVSRSDLRGSLHTGV